MASEIKHDWQRWGPAFTADTPPRVLVRVADLVRRQMDEKTPLRMAAGVVIGKLIRCRVDPYFLLNPHRRVVSLTDGALWNSPEHYRLANAGVRASYADPWVLSPDRIEEGVWASARAPTHDALGRQFRWRGVSGVIPCLCECWLSVAKQEADLDQDIASLVAILKTDADRLFGLSQAAPVKHQLEKLKKPGDKWTAAHRVGLLAQFTDLTSGPNRMKFYLADIQIAAAWGISESSVKQQRLLAAKEHKAGCTA